MFNYNGYRVWFEHKRLEDPSTAMFSTFPLAQALTICHIVNDDGQKVGEGIAACSRMDSFNRYVGRKIALDRALTDAVVIMDGNPLITTRFTKTERGGFWSAYFEHIGMHFEHTVTYKITEEDVTRIFRDMRLLGAFSPERWKADTAEGAAEIFIRCLTCDYTDGEINFMKGLKGDKDGRTN